MILQRCTSKGTHASCHKRREILRKVCYLKEEGSKSVGPCSESHRGMAGKHRQRTERRSAPTGVWCILLLVKKVCHILDAHSQCPVESYTLPRPRAASNSPIYCASKCSSPLFTIPSICFPSATTVCPVPPLISHQGLCCVPLSHTVSKSHTLLYCSAHLTWTCKVCGWFCVNNKPKLPCFHKNLKALLHRAQYCFEVKLFLLGVQHTFANQIQAESGHIQMTCTPTCISDNCVKHCSLWHIEIGFHVQSLVPRQGFDNSVPGKIQSHHQVMKTDSAGLLWKNTCYFARMSYAAPLKVEYCNTKNTSYMVMPQPLYIGSTHGRTTGCLRVLFSYLCCLCYNLFLFSSPLSCVYEPKGISSSLFDLT